MKKLLFVLLFLTSTSAFSWYGGYGPGMGYGMGYGGYGMGYGGYPPGAYGAMGYGWGIQAPSFNYNTVIQQSPPIIVNNAQPPQVVYRENPKTAAENERLRSYFGK